jgi:hypothetical protein
MLTDYGALGVELVRSMPVMAAKSQYTAYVFQANVEKAASQLTDQHAKACVVDALAVVDRTSSGYTRERRRRLKEDYGVTLPMS